jgi:spore germination cell wall hydrolase CwlJ-like protein
MTFMKTRIGRKSLIGGAFAVFAFTGALQAEVTVSQSNTGSAMDAGILQLLTDERSAMNDVVERFDAIAPAPGAKFVKARTSAQASAISDIDYSTAWVANQPAAEGGEQFQCLADVLYFESRGESVAGQAAVAEVVLNRVESPKFPNSICGVVHQSNSNGCQFSWTCDGKTDKIRNQEAYAQVAKVARALMDGAPRALTDGATYFHTPAVRPSWARKFTRTAKVGSHIFYRPQVRTAQN